MKSKLIQDLKSLAHDIIGLEDELEIEVLRNKIREIYERICALNYLEKNSDVLEQSSTDTSEDISVSQTDSIDVQKESITKEEFEENLERNFNGSQEHETSNFQESSENSKGKGVEVTDLNDIFIPKFDSIKDDFSQKEEFKDTVSLDDTEKLFETKKEYVKPLSLNDKLLKNTIQIGLNDRIAFVNKLFNFSQLEFNQTLSILNQFELETDAKRYIKNTLKTKYDWNGKEEIEERFIILVERKFL